MREILHSLAPVLGILGFAYLTFNVMVFVGVSNGGHADYIPYLNAPIKFFVQIAG